ISELVQINDGILSIRGCVRKLDLDHLEGEARFHCRPHGKVLDAQGKKLMDPVAEIEGTFLDLIEAARRDPSSAFDISDESTLEDLRIGLQKEEAGSAVVIGPAGSGKTQLIRSFAAQIARGAYPEI